MKAQEALKVEMKQEGAGKWFLAQKKIKNPWGF
jgi:hypothetical protein